MDTISKFLDKYAKNINKSRLVKDEIIKIISEKIGVEVNSKQIELKNKNLILKTSPKVKLAVILHKKVILEEIDKIFNEKIIVEIK
ncbi:MAG: hypothetical protein NTV48_01605 [Candidatus Vogelbacteria bacterium]|nr:hypothetical protein [Candidatus Vogelbacteria bacterium]